MAKPLREGVGTLQSRLAWYISPDSTLGLPELAPAPVEPCERPPTGARLNLILPMLVGRWFYGGMATAVRFFRSLGEQFEHQRIIFTDQTEAEFEFQDWADWVVDRGEVANRSIAFLADRRTPLTVSPSDYFIATCWHTAVHVKHYIAKQEELFGKADRRFVYLIQDYEPSFYAWSARHMAARSTYSNGHKILAVFNTQLLADYFANQGFRFASRHVFEPMLHPALKAAKTEQSVQKERLILVYGRPTQLRNNFEMLIEALDTWAKNYPAAGDWSVMSAGEPHDDIALSKGVVLKACGKLSPDEYARILKRTWAGVSLMLSPHPSYPPLEMAEFGAWVVTNTFENKNLSSLARNIISVEELSPVEIAERLAWCCDQYQPGKTAVVHALPPVFNAADEEFPFTRELVAGWLKPGHHPELPQARQARW